MPLRKLAALLDIDTSTLSKIERKERSANPSMINVIAIVFKVDVKEVQILYWMDKIISEFGDDTSVKDVLKGILERMDYQEESYCLRD